MTFLVCPKCKNKYNIEINKIPEKGVNIECEFCHEIWFVKKDEFLPDSQKKQILEPQSRYFQESDEYINRAVSLKGNPPKKFAGDDFIKKVSTQTKEEKINKFRRKQPTNIQIYLQKQMGDYDLFTELYNEEPIASNTIKPNKQPDKKIGDQEHIFSESDKESFDKYLKSIATETSISNKPILSAVITPNVNEELEKNIKNKSLYNSSTSKISSESNPKTANKEEILTILPEGSELETSRYIEPEDKKKFPTFSVIIGVILAGLIYSGIEYKDFLIAKYQKVISHFDTNEYEHTFSIEESTTYTKNFNNEPYLWIKLKLTNISDQKRLLTPVSYTIMNSDNQILDSDKITFPNVELNPNESYVTDRVLIPYDSNITYKLSLNID